MKNFFIQLGILCLTITSLNSFGQEWKVFTTQNSGLPHNWIYDIAIDGNGVKWVAGFMGLSRFDDNFWFIYDSTNSSIPNRNLQTVAVDDSNHVWVGNVDYLNGTGGLSKYDGSGWTFYDKENAGSGLPDDNILSLDFSTDGDVWVGTAIDGIGVLTDTGWYSFRPINSNIPSNQINDIKFIEDSCIWIASGLPALPQIGNGGLSKLNDTDWTVFDQSNSNIPGNHVYCVELDSQDNIWIGTSDGLGKYDGNSWANYTTTNSSFTDNRVFALESIDSVLWVGTFDGLFQFDQIGWKRFDTINSTIPSNRITSLLVDSVKNIWIGTSKGLAVYNEDSLVLGTSGIYSSNKLEVRVFPNPNNGIFSIVLQGMISEVNTVDIYDIKGNAVYSKNIQHSFFSGMLNINLNDLKSGIYFITINNNMLGSKTLIIHN